MIAITKLLDLLNKKGLIYWANKIGLEGTTLAEYRKQSTKKGISKHSEVENYLQNQTPFKESDLLDKCLNKYEIIAIEDKISNGFISGKIDLIIEKDNQTTIVDFKSNNNIYLEHKIQLSTYKELYQADHIAVIDFNKWELIILDIDTKQYYAIIKSLYQIYKLLQNLDERI